MYDKNFLMSEAISAGVEVVKNIINEILAEIRPKMDIEDMQRVYVKVLNKVILDEELKNNTKYVGGTFEFDYVDDRSYTCGYNLFFQDEKKKVFEIAAKSRPLNMAKLADELVLQIKGEKIVKFEIPEPSLEVRQQHNLENFKG